MKISPNIQMGKQPGVLEYVSNPASVCGYCVSGFVVEPDLTLELDAPGRTGFPAGKYTQHRALAGAAGPEQGGDPLQLEVVREMEFETRIANSGLDR
jgi:hypothetical protein